MSGDDLPKLNDLRIDIGLLERAITRSGLILSQTEARCILAELRELRAHKCKDRFLEGYEEGRRSHS